VVGDHHVPEVAVGRALRACIREQAEALEAHVLDTGVHELEAHEHREAHRDQADDRRRDQVEDTDILVVGGHEPAGEKPAIVVMFMTVNGCVRHEGLPFLLDPDRLKSCRHP
jgi:hypothetical protein